MDVYVFRKQESSYLDWLTEHEDGFVLNSLAAVSKKYLVLHTATCNTISKADAAANVTNFTGGVYIKVCASTVSGLLAWLAEQDIFEFSHQCEICCPLGTLTKKRLTWTREELILALDLYFREPSARGNEKHPAVVELSELLQELPIYAETLRPPNFRNTNGVAMKLGNFLAYDPAYGGSGLGQGALLERDVWDQFSGDLARLAEEALTIREHYPFIDVAGVAATAQDCGVHEGGIVHAIHKRYERDSSISRKKKATVFAERMALRCEVCDFDFHLAYGEIGSEFAECHHNKPVSKMKPGDKTRLTDLSIVCANCHRMLHRGREWLAIQTLREIYTKQAELQAVKETFTN